MLGMLPANQCRINIEGGTEPKWMKSGETHIVLCKNELKNIAKAMDNAKEDMKRIWNVKLEQLLKIRGRKALKDLKIKLEWSTSNLLVWVILTMGTGIMIVNIVTMINMYSVIETMWLEIQQVKETNISLYQFIQEHRDDFN